MFKLVSIIVNNYRVRKLKSFMSNIKSFDDAHRGLYMLQSKYIAVKKNAIPSVVEIELAVCVTKLETTIFDLSMECSSVSWEWSMTEEQINNQVKIRMNEYIHGRKNISVNHRYSGCLAALCRRVVGD